MSSDSAHLVAKIEKYITNLKEGHKVRHALQRLEQMDMTVDLLTKTGVGKVVNRVSREDPEYANLAVSIVARWKKIAQAQQEMKERSPSPIERRIKKEVKEEYDANDYPGESSSKSSSATNNNERKRKVKEEESSPVYGETKRDKKDKKSKPAPANAFLAALASGDAVKADKPKKLKPFNLTLDITPNYRPMPSLSVTKQAGKADDEPFDQAQMFKPRSGLTKIFAGRKKATTLDEVPSLFDCCIRVLQNHINEIDSFGDIPFHIIKPILEKCTWQQLYEIEKKNPYLEEDSDELWEKLVSKHHPGKPTRSEESWKTMFMRCVYESENKLKALSDRISKDGKASKDNVRKVVTITDVKMTRGSRKGAVVDMPSALQVSKARKEIFDSGSKAQLSQINSTVVARNSTVGASSHRKKEVATVVKAGPKKGALMAKTMKMLGMKRGK